MQEPKPSFISFGVEMFPTGLRNSLGELTHASRHWFEQRGYELREPVMLPKPKSKVSYVPPYEWMNMPVPKDKNGNDRYLSVDQAYWKPFISNPVSIQQLKV